MNFFTQVKESVIDFKHYLKIRNNTFGKTFSYFLLLFLIAYIMSGIKWYNDFSIIINELSYGLSRNMPDFRLEGGAFTFNGSMPYEIINSSHEKFIIDTTGKTTPQAFESVESGILITRDYMLAKNNMQARKVNFKDIPSLKLSKEDIVKTLPRLPGLLAVVLIFGFMFAFIWKLLNALILALVGILVSKNRKTDIKFNNMFNFAVYSLTFPILLELAVTLSGVVMPYFGVAYWVISIMYLMNAIKYYKESIRNNDESGIELK